MTKLAKLTGTLLVAGTFAAACVQSSSKTESGSGSGGGSPSGSGPSGPSSGPGGGSDPSFDRRAMIESVGKNVVYPAYLDFVASAAALQAAANQYALSLTQADHDAARSAWRAAASVWQRAEVYQLGPAGLMGTTPGGEDLRDEIYSWPTTNPCRVDQGVVNQGYTSESTLRADVITVRGLDALEYLLFVGSSGNACTPQTNINSTGAWAALGDGEVKKRRADYAAVAAAILVGDAQRLADRWDPSKGKFLSELASAGSGSQVYPTTQVALNALSDALFYIENEVKDMKVGLPAGIQDGCLEAVCPNLVESRFAKRSKQHLLDNLTAARRLFLGGPPEEDLLGFDDLLASVGHTGLAANMDGALEASYAAVAAIEPDDLQAALVSNLGSVTAAYAALKTFSDLLKTDFLSQLDLEAPQKSLGDND